MLSQEPITNADFIRIARYNPIFFLPRSIIPQGTKHQNKINKRSEPLEVLPALMGTACFPYGRTQCDTHHNAFSLPHIAPPATPSVSTGPCSNFKSATSAPAVRVIVTSIRRHPCTWSSEDIERTRNPCLFSRSSPISNNGGIRFEGIHAHVFADIQSLGVYLKEPKLSYPLIQPTIVAAQI